jgi:hypothetical protein
MSSLRTAPPPPWRRWTLAWIVALGLAQAAASAHAQVCSATDARALFTTARAWLDAQSLPPAPDVTPPDFGRAAGLSPDFTATAAGVVLRLDGRPVGQACVRQVPGAAPSLGPALLESLRQASKDRILSALPAEERLAAPRRLSLEIELAGEARPLVGDRIDALSARIDNGRQAMAIRCGDRWAFSLPALQQSLNQTQLPWHTLIGLAREVGVETGADRRFRLPEGVVVYRADTRRLAQIAPAAPPFEAPRGMIAVPPSAVTAAALDRAARAIAAHLAARLRAPQGLSPEAAAALRALGPAGEYNPALGSAGQQVCPPLEQAMSAYAMARFAEGPFAENERLAAREYAVATLQSLRTVVGQEKDPLEVPAAAAACLLCAKSLDRVNPSWADAEAQAWMKRLDASVAAALARENSGDLQTWALCAAARAADSPAEVAAALNAAWRTRPVEKLLAASPWLLLAQRSLGAVDAAEAAQAWEALQSLLVQSQLSRAADRDLPADLEGGWPIATGGVPAATAQSARPALAMALATSMRLIPMGATARDPDREALRLALRFLLQLQVDEASCYAFREPGRALGGIRAAPWDSSQPLGANAAALLAMLEARGALGDGAAVPP